MSRQQADNIPVILPTPSEQQASYRVSMYTALNRRGSFIGDALASTVKRVGAGKDLRVVSAGCSNGAEVDSVLGLHWRGVYAGRIAITGYDASALAIREAEEGLYQASLVDEQIERVEGMGFEIMDRDEDGDVYISPHQLRAKHDVSFVQHNLLQPLPQAEGADLILVNNVLYHHNRRRDVMKIVDNLCQVLNQNGVIGFGSTFAPQSTVWHENAWHRDPIDLMADQYGLKPILQIGSTPILFSRIGSHSQVGADVEGGGVSPGLSEGGAEVA